MSADLAGYPHAALVLDSREKLGGLWLPWYMDRDGPGAWGGSVDLRRCRQVTVADVCEGRADPVLDIPHDNGWTHRDRIAHYERIIEDGAAIDPVLCGFHVAADRERVLADGCHRACAGFNRWERRGGLHLTMLCGPPGDWPIDADPRLRE
ncbi:MAG: hypothetical protein U0R70_03145 [Solirubrobacteraceae bacterium]